MYFSKNIKYLRKILCLTQADLADLLYIDRTTIEKYENGTREPSLVMLVLISKTLKVTIDDLLKKRICDY